MKNKVRMVAFWMILVLMFLLSVIVKSTSNWFDMRFGVSFEEVLFTITSPLAGSDVSFLSEAVDYVMPEVFITLKYIVLVLLGAVFFWVVLVQFDIRIGKLRIKIECYKLYQVVFLLVSVALLMNSLAYGVNILGIDTYIARKIDKTSIYEEYYVDPNDVEITTKDAPRNLIYIYLESMETTYASSDVGGSQEINYIPNLTDLAKNNISFSHNEKLGGADLVPGSGWTMGALLSTTSGIPFSLPIEGNSMGTFEKFLPGVTTLGDILQQKGYEQVFLCGSNGNFAGRQSYFEQHGNYDVIDYYDAVNKNYISSDYFVWWGLEDQKLYDIAKDELLILADGDEPFNFTMLTVDTHHIDGYVCDICEDTYPEQLANVVKCADNQILDFVNWCMEQDFYENTTIVITGDHFRMDSSLIYEESDRKMYNCFINSAKTPKSSINNRTFTILDMFPTTLSALGYDISGNKLGLGTDLFSGVSTLAEEISFDKLYLELGKHSEYYMKEFSK